ncbi:MAG: SusF/SusE family outer membrane protein [Paludibacteraceae bacterium]|nr:SusF/SusE family outer membrane protein [Paludibacteraceae bacterium]
MKKNLSTLNVSGLLSLSVAVFILLAAGGLTSCEKPAEPVVEKELALTLSADSVFCLPVYKDLAALEMSWTPGTNHGTGSAIAYTLEMDREGNNFADGLKWEIGRTANRTMVFSHRQLADTLYLTYPEVKEGEYVVFDCRVRALVVQTGEEQVSAVAKVAIAWNATMITDLYLVGDATPHGWDLARATAMIMDMTNFTTFSWSGTMHKGEFKLMSTTEDWIPCFVKDSTDDSKMVYRDSEQRYPDFKWTIDKTGSYRITADVEALTIEVAYLGGEAYSHIYMIGDAAPGGWSWDNLTEMQHTETGIFTYEGHLNTGQIKFPTEIRSDWSGEMLYAPEPDCAPAENGTFDAHAGAPDNKWLIPESGEWSIRININDTTISFSKL